MIRMLLISNMYPSLHFPHYGTFVKKFNQGLQEKGVQVERITICKKPNKFSKLLAYLTFFLKVIFVCNFKKNRYNVIYIHYINHTLIPFLFVRKKNLPVLILNAHGGDLFYETKGARFIGRITSRIILHATKIVVPSNYFKQEILKKIQFSADNIFISPSSGINLDLLNPKIKLFNNEVLSIGYLGRIDKDKGRDTFIEAMDILKQTGCKFKIHIGGDGKESVKLNELVTKLGLINETVRYGFVDHNKVSSFFAKIDILVFPSRRKGESLGLVAIEALACGVPVIANSNGAISDYILNKKNGFIYRNDSKVELIEKIQDYIALSDKEKIEMHNYSMKSVVKYDSNRIASEMYDFIKDTISNNKNG